jgi:hypothetical protein
MGKSLLPMLAGVGLAAATGGLSAGASGALGAAGGTGAAGAGALGAGNALAAQGAAGLLGGAGATAAGYGAPMVAGLGAAGGAGATMVDPATLSSQWGDNIGTLQNTIESSGMTANPYTGGFDNLSGIDRIGQRVSGFLDDGGMDTLGKFKNAFGGQQEQPQQAQNTEISAPVAPQEQAQGQMPNVYGQPAIQLTDEQKRQYLAMQQQGLMYG